MVVDTCGLVLEAVQRGNGFKTCTLTNKKRRGQICRVPTVKRLFGVVGPLFIVHLEMSTTKQQYDMKGLWILERLWVHTSYRVPVHFSRSLRANGHFQ